MAIRIKPVFSSTGTAGRVAVFDPSTGLLTASVVTTDELELLSGITGGDILTETNVKTVSGKTFNQDLVADATNEHDIGSSGVRWKDAYLAGQLNAASGDFSGNVTIDGDLTVSGTTTTVGTTNLEVTDANILVNNGGNDATSEGAGLTVERTATNGSLIYADASGTKWRAGASGAEVDLVGTTPSQTLTNKTIVVASNTITTAATGNLAATELNAALAELQSDVDTRATATALSDHINDTSAAHAASAVSFTPTGNIAASDVQAMGAELQGDIDALDTRLDTAEGSITTLQADVITAQSAADAAQTSIDNHLVDTTAAHAASAVSVTPAGNLAADDVQEALTELQSDIDTRALDSDLTAHLNDTSDAHDASAISSVASGNLAATDVQTALNELQTDVDTRATSVELSTHESDTSTHGVSGAIVGTTDAQALTNKDIDGGTASNTNRITLPKNTKTNLDGLTRKEGTVVYGTDTQKAYVDNGSNLIPIGSGSGGGSGINLLTLDSSFTAGANQNNFDFEDATNGVGTWAVYADAAATSPVDMTGGSPGTTIARITTGELNGSASAQVDLGSGSSRQGEGWMTPAHIPPAYRGRTLTCLMPYAITGSVVEDDLVPYCYDVTNSQLIKPYVKDKLLGSSGVAHFTFPVGTNTAEVRVGVHIARSSTAALSITFDDVQLSPFSTPVGLAGTEWTNEGASTITATTTAPTKGTVSYDSVKKARLGPSAIIKWDYLQTAAGSAGSGTYLFLMPAGLRIDTTKIRTGLNTGTLLGHAEIATNTSYSGSTAYTFNVYAYDATRLALTRTTGGTAQGWDSTIALAFSSSNLIISMTTDAIPIEGWSANVSMAESSTYWISSFLANGTRVTSLPTKLGEYRSYAKSGSAYTYSDAAPNTAPSATNGMHIQGVTYSGSGGSNGNNRYEIFIGRNKNFSLAAWQNTGRTGQLDWRHFFASTSTEIGISHSYDPTTGVITVDAGATDSSVSNRYLGNVLTPAGAALTQPGSGYFDIQVSENALAVGVQAPRSSVTAAGYTGYGSTNTKIVRFTALVESIGSGVVYDFSSVNGDTFTIKEDGVYAVSFAAYGNSSSIIGISLNATGLTTNISSTTWANGNRGLTYNSATAAAVSKTMILRAGDVLRAHTDGVALDVSTAYTQFTVTKVAH